MFGSLVDHASSFVQAHAAWTPVIAGVLAFCESLAIVSFFVPATVVLIAVGGLIGGLGLSFWTVWAGAVIGAVLGDWLSFAAGLYFKKPLLRSSLYARYRSTADKALAFLHKWGAFGVFLGRFSGPLRAFVPLAAGLTDVPQWQFQLANVASALLWAFLLLSPGTLLGHWL